MNDELRKRILNATRDYNVQNVLFRNAIAKRLGINITDMECLGLLFHKKLATPTELAEYTGLSSGATTAMLDRLERAGLIERRPNPEDRRGTLISVRQIRPEVMSAWFASAYQAEKRLLAGFSEQELTIVAQFLEQSIQMWEEERQKLLKP